MGIALGEFLLADGLHLRRQRGDRGAFDIRIVSVGIRHPLEAFERPGALRGGFQDDLADEVLLGLRDERRDKLLAIEEA